MARIQVIMGTTRMGCFGGRVAPWVLQRLRDHGFDVELVGLRDCPLPFFDQKPPSVTPRNYPSGEVARLGRKLDNADVFVILAGEYNHGYPAVLKNAMDHTFVERRRKPVAFVGWGGVGGARVIEQLPTSVCSSGSTRSSKPWPTAWNGGCGPFPPAVPPAYGPGPPAAATPASRGTRRTGWDADSTDPGAHARARVLPGGRSAGWSRTGCASALLPGGAASAACAVPGIDDDPRVEEAGVRPARFFRLR